jgi:hypothetical protein
MKKILIIAILVIAVYAYFQNQKSLPVNGEQASISDSSTKNSDSIIASAYSNHKSNVQVSGEGKVIKVLSDDNDGSRHQRFVIRMASGQTLLVAHNIDISPRIESLQKGDMIQFSGEYEWNADGGVIHWTHHNPVGSHTAGWLKHNGHIYQ